MGRMGFLVAPVPTDCPSQKNEEEAVSQYRKGFNILSPLTLGSFLVLHVCKDLDLNLYLHIEIVVTVSCLSKKYMFLIYFSLQLS